MDQHSLERNADKECAGARYSVACAVFAAVDAFPFERSGDTCDLTAVTPFMAACLTALVMDARGARQGGEMAETTAERR